MIKPNNKHAGLTNRFEDFIQEEKLIPPNGLTLLALSGGIDSMVMAHLFLVAGFRFEIAHVNFQLRGKESIEDKNFVVQWAIANKINYHITEFDLKSYAQQKSVSIQMAARTFRYDWFETIRIRIKANSVATAHHLDDSIETILHNLTRGTGIAGLHGILPKKDHLIRPLLFATRDDITLYAEKNQIKYRTDSSNTDTKYTRNFIRQNVIPVLKQINPGLDKTFRTNIQALRATEHLYQEGIIKLKKTLLEKRGNDWFIPIRKLGNLAYPKQYLFECIRDFGFTYDLAEKAMDLTSSQAGSYIECKEYRIIKYKDFLILTKSREDLSTFISISKGKKKLQFGAGTLKLNAVSKAIFNKSNNKCIAFADKKNIRYPLILRLWKAGDYFYPLGMQRKKKKISDFLIDEKIALHQKEKIWVLASNEKIIWVVGHRLDDRFKIIESTKSILKMEFKPNPDSSI